METEREYPFSLDGRFSSYLSLNFRRKGFTSRVESLQAEEVGVGQVGTRGWIFWSQANEAWVRIVGLQLFLWNKGFSKQ